MNILLIGSGGREHAMAWKIVQSNKCDKLYCAPGNAGISEVAECVNIGVNDTDEILKFVKNNNIEFVIVGPEDPLVNGLASALREENISVFGPSKEAAQMEGSKGFMKDFCKRHNIPTAAYERFTDVDNAIEYIQKQESRIVIKTDGLAAGKGVIIPETTEEAIQSLKEMMSGSAFGDAGTEVVVEEFMEGEELSYFALADGENYLALASAQDHKRVGDGDTGLNTGGMGAYSPAHCITDDLEAKIIKDIIEPTVQGMKQDGMPFQGILFAGIMIVNGNPKLIEYNIRFGDPETQAIMPRLESDFVDLLLATDQGNLNDYKNEVKFKDDVALCVVMAANGYPEAYEKNTVISGTQNLEKMEDTFLFHAGTKLDDDNKLINTGGRVLNVVGIASTVSEAQLNAYKGVDKIEWPEGFCRRDIGWRAIAAKKEKAA